MVLDLPNDKAEILGTWVDLNLTSVGHYAVDIMPRDNRAAEEVLLTLPEETKDKDNVLRKLH